jgi:hypothetical protein
LKHQKEKEKKTRKKENKEKGENRRLSDCMVPKLNSYTTVVVLIGRGMAEAVGSGQPDHTNQLPKKDSRTSRIGSVP